MQSLTEILTEVKGLPEVERAEIKKGRVYVWIAGAQPECYADQHIRIFYDPKKDKWTINGLHSMGFSHNDPWQTDLFGQNLQRFARAHGMPFIHLGWES